MPPKPKLNKNDIVNLAFEHVRRHGWQGLTARHLAEMLNVSTKPIYFHFDAMAGVEEEVVSKALDLVLDYTRVSRSGDPWVDQAVGVVLFALEEKHLFRAIFDAKHVAVRKKYSVKVWDEGRKQLSGYALFQGLTDQQVEMIRRARWVITHGLASLLNISNWPWQQESEALLVQLIQRLSRAVYNEFKDDPDILLSREYLDRFRDQK